MDGGHALLRSDVGDMSPLGEIERVRTYHDGRFADGKVGKDGIDLCIGADLDDAYR